MLAVISESVKFEYQSGHLTESTSRVQTDLSNDSENVKNSKEKVISRSKIESSAKLSAGCKRSNGTELERADGWVGEVLSSAVDSAQSAIKTYWTHVIQIISSCLKSSDTQHFYNLGCSISFYHLSCLLKVEFYLILIVCLYSLFGLAPMGSHTPNW